MTRLRQIFWQHPLYYLPLIFLSFPVLGIFYFDYPVWTIWGTLAFTASYLYLVHHRPNAWTMPLWLYMLAYVVYMTLYVNGGMIWFFFYFCDLLVYHFEDPVRSPRFISYLLAMLGVVVMVFVWTGDLGVRLMALLVPFINLVMIYNWRLELKAQQQAETLAAQHREIDQLSAENERNRIGRDLHDTLGHTFAMLTLKTELALKQLDKANMTAVRKELEELHRISRESMQEVRTIINNLKYRTVDEEIAVLTDLFALSEMALTVENELTTHTLSPVIQSNLTMILRELTNNVIKHSQASQVHLRLFADKGLHVMIEDDGIGFGPLTGQELHSIRERMGLNQGEVTITSLQNPTRIEVLLKEGLS